MTLRGFITFARWVNATHPVASFFGSLVLLLAGDAQAASYPEGAGRSIKPVPESPENRLFSCQLTRQVDKGTKVVNGGIRFAVAKKYLLGDTLLPQPHWGDIEFGSTFLH